MTSEGDRVDVNDDDDDDVASDENLDELLAKMNIDKDFNAWTSFRSSVLSQSVSNHRTSGASDETEDSKELLDPEIQKWTQRVARLEVYSKHYKRTEAETQELVDLAAFLGLNKSFRLASLFGKKTSVDADSAHRQRFDAIQDSSILLLRGFALLEESGSTQDVEIVLLTYGLVVAKVKGQDSKRNLILRSLLYCITWDQVDHMTPSVAKPRAWEVHFKAESDDQSTAPLWTFTTASSNQQITWLSAMETVLVRTRMHSSSRTASQPLGWQYQLVHRGGFTAAVTGHIDSVPIVQVNICDQYNGLAPIHYAVRLGHANVVRHLLQCRADANLPDSEGHTPMYYAVRDDLLEIQELLYDFGAQRSFEAEQCGCGELFGRIADTQEIIDDRRTVQAEQAAAAQAQMAENMRALQMRGEKIRDLGDKATQLNDGAATYADLARQLKEKSSKPSFFGIL